ncbi:sigma-54-dependent Fis family transcriptional regulator [Bacillus cereus]|uniref:Sigma-54-dependent Fis family transcriptional regulator n=2 Tax=Bacillus TaxID=1386 RepID=A0AA44Q7R2_BACCE|nr:sigma-54-dependent Fis family transcriptional regulator [Bacillus cereus]PFO77919.1 sigma-54-dependent Fis family transcriptional regulator [Bacillus cereus]PFR97237.1 sigma-54-dependent Fis family transcriptional regulator [Bacillus cereus]
MYKKLTHSIQQGGISMTIALPSIDQLMNKDFFFFPSLEEWEQHKQTDYEDTTVLVEKNNDIYMLTANNMYQPCYTTSYYSSISHILKKLKNYPAVVFMNASHKPIGFITAVMLAETIFQSYEYLQVYFETVIKTTDASVTVIDEKENVNVWTNGAEAIFSVRRQDILGKPITSFFHEDMLEILKTLQEGRSLHKHQHQPREDLIVLINSNPIYLRNKIIGAVVSETDITSQVRLNQELFSVSTKMHQLEKQVAQLTPSVDPFHAIKGNSTALHQTIETAKKICTTKSTVLILGESGVGKELFAKAIHEARENEHAPFISINCGAIPESLFESELFGYEKGAFSGADQKGKKGKIELAKGGTLFLDEIGEMPMEMQVKLLRVLQDKTFYRVGGVKELHADFNIIAATNRNLKEQVAQGKFREDLFYRLNVVSIDVPPLRERKEDIVELIHSFLYEFSIQYNRPIQNIPQDVMYELLEHKWPGNIRELRNAIERIVVFATDGIIKREDLPFSTKTTKEQPSVPLSVNITEGELLDDALNKYERNIIQHALELENGNKLACAKRLGITRATLYNRMKKLSIPF